MKFPWVCCVAVSTLMASACSGHIGDAAPTPAGTTVTTTNDGIASLSEPAIGLVPVDRVSADTATVIETRDGVVAAVLDHRYKQFSVRTPCGNHLSLPESAAASMYDVVDIVLDPGHGGPVETGAVGPNGLVEKELNLTLAQAAERLLVDAGYRVALTRRADYQVPLFVRAEIVDAMAPRAFVSIHHNAPNANPSPLPGTEIFVQVGNDESRRLGGLIYEYVVEALSAFNVDWVRTSDAGALAVVNHEGNDTYGMVRRPEAVTVLAEFAYLSNSAEAELLATDAYIDTAAAALTDALVAFLETSAPGSGFVDTPRVFVPNGLTGGLNGCEDPATLVDSQ